MVSVLRSATGQALAPPGQGLERASHLHGVAVDVQGLRFSICRHLPIKHKLSFQIFALQKTVQRSPQSIPASESQVHVWNKEQ